MWSKIKQVLSYAWTEFCHIVHDVFAAEEKVVMAQLFNMLKNDAISIQNSQPGINSKQMREILELNAQSALVTLGSSIAYTAIITTIGTLMHDLNVPDASGNVGKVS